VTTVEQGPDTSGRLGSRFVCPDLISNGTAAEGGCTKNSLTSDVEQA
jgi:hypothetical protein